MEKLIELLLEYKPQIHYLDKPKGVYDKKYGIGWYKREWDIGGWFSEEVIISKKFGFLQRLVEHNKLLHPNFVQHLKLFYGDTMPEWNYYIMMLSIADSPIAELNKMLRPY